MPDLANVLLTNTTRPPSASDRDYDRLLASTVDSLRSELSVKGGARIRDAELLQVLHPAQNTVGYTFLLYHLVIDRTSDAFVIALVAYLTQFDPVQVRYVGMEFRYILELTEEVIRATKNLQLLQPLRNAILRLDPSSATLTSSHVSFLNLCLEARRPREALPILDKDTVDFAYSDIQGIDVARPCAEHDRSSRFITKRSELSGDITVLQVQEYHLLGALIYIGQRRYSRARLFLELVIATPTLNNVADMYMAEAYQKLILVALVMDGRPPQTTNLIEQGPLRTLQQVSKPYEALAEAFLNRDLARFHAEVDAAGPLWANDGNLGLVQRVGEALRRRRVMDLQRTYAALPVAQVATALGLSAGATLTLLQQMIADGHLRASVATARVKASAAGMTNGSSAGAGAATGGGNDEEAPVLRFEGWHEPRAEDRDGIEQAADADADDGARVEAQIRRVQVLADAVAEADRRLALTREYADWVRRNKKNADAGAAAFEDPMEMDDGGGDAPGPGSFDEDIMAA